MLHNPSDLYKTEWLDLVFKNRNQHYGAYVLRKESSATMFKSLCIAVPVFTLLFCYPMIHRLLKPDEVVEHKAPTGFVIDLPLPVLPKAEEKKQDEKKQEMPKTEPVKEKVKMVKMPSNIKVVEQPAIDQTPPTIDEIKGAIIGPATQDGSETDMQAVSSGTGSISGGVGSGVSDDNAVYDPMTIEAYPEFEGGMKAWARYIQRNLRYPYQAQEEGIQGKVYVSFIIEKDGSVSGVKLIRGIGAGCDEEAVRVISKSPKWKPGRQNAHNVRVRYSIPISFALQ